MRHGRFRLALVVPAVAVLLLHLVAVAPSRVDQQQRGQLRSCCTGAAGWQVGQGVRRN